MDIFRERLEAKIGENIVARMEELTKVLEPNAYLVTCGAIQALRGVLVLCEDTEKELDR